LPFFAKAEAWRDGKTPKILFELRAGGYKGSRYTLTHDPVKNGLQGVSQEAGRAMGLRGFSGGR
jgi:hypothetical protein